MLITIFPFPFFFFKENNMSCSSMFNPYTLFSALTLPCALGPHPDPTDVPEIWSLINEYNVVLVQSALLVFKIAFLLPTGIS